jgi:thiol-disulfide isomerase/thioredoxin
MKKLFLILLLAVGSVYSQADVVKFTAKIANRNSDTIMILGRKFKQVIPIDKNGVFTATFPVTAGPHQFSDGTESSLLYLKNGYDLKLEMDAKMFDESIKYSGVGMGENNFLAQKMLIDEQFEISSAGIKDQAAYMAALDKKTAQLESLMASLSKDEDFKTIAGMMLQGEKQQQAAGFSKNLKVSSLIGKASPGFDFENHKGGKTKLADLKGKYVYIDTWATWCGPCIAEIPHLKRVEQKYHGKKIEFVSISIDEKKDYEKWKKMVVSKELGGVQLIADNAWSSQFAKDYSIDSIPRFILIGPDGNVIDANAKRPSDPGLISQLDALLTKK